MHCRGMTDKKLKRGDPVAWNTSQGETTGKVIRRLTRAADIKGHHVAATEEEPQYLVESEVSGELAAHKPEALRRRG